MTFNPSLSIKGGREGGDSQGVEGKGRQSIRKPRVGKHKEMELSDSRKDHPRRRWKQKHRQHTNTSTTKSTVVDRSNISGGSRKNQGGEGKNFLSKTANLSTGGSGFKRKNQGGINFL